MYLSHQLFALGRSPDLTFVIGQIDITVIVVESVIIISFQSLTIEVQVIILLTLVALVLLTFLVIEVEVVVIIVALYVRNLTGLLVAVLIKVVETAVCLYIL